MQLWRDDQRQSRAVLACVAVMGLLAVASLSRVFDEAVYIAWAIPAMAVGATFALTYGRRSLAIAFGLLCVVCLFTLPSLFAREFTSFLVPSRAAWRFVWALAQSGMSGMVNEEAPVPVSPRYLVVLWVAGLAGGFLGASWIVVGRPLGALLTAVGLVTFSGQVGVGPRRDVFAFLTVVVIGAFLLIDGRHRIANWGTPRRHVPPELGTGMLAAASLIGLLGPIVLGTNTPWLELSAALRPRVVVIKPLADIQRQLRIEPPVEVLRVRAGIPAYWRLTALNEYTGREWVLQARPRASKDGVVPAPEQPAQGPLLQQQFRITSLLAPWLPAAYAALEVDSAVPFEVDEATSTLLLKDETLPGLNYSVTSRLPNNEAISKIIEPAGKPDAAEASFVRFIEPVVRSAKTPYEQALAIQNFFRGFRYDEKVRGGHDRARLERFLSERIGYCEQFAATMTLMLRGLGTPARVAVGFLPGGVARSGDYVATTKDAHAWVEALIPGMGWVPFDPTPGRGLPAGSGEQQAAPAQASPIPAQPSADPGQSPNPDEQGENESGTRRNIPVRTLAYLMLAGAVVAAVPSAKTYRRRRRRAGPPVESALGAYAELVDGLSDLGVRVRAADTQWELWDRAFSRGRGPGATSASRVVHIAARTIYGPDGVLAEEADQAWTELLQALRELRASKNWWVRTRATFDPRTFIPQGAPFAQLARA